MFKRIKQAWKLSKKDHILTEEILNKALVELPDEETKAEFFGAPTPEEELEFQRTQEGTKAWYDRLKKL